MTPPATPPLPWNHTETPPENVQSVASRLQISIPAVLHLENGYAHEEALFGIPKYGGSIAEVRSVLAPLSRIVNPLTREGDRALPSVHRSCYKRFFPAHNTPQACPFICTNDVVVCLVLRVWFRNGNGMRGLSRYILEEVIRERAHRAPNVYGTNLASVCHRTSF